MKKDYSNQTFNKLTIIGRDFSKNGNYWLCKCGCSEQNIYSLLISRIKRKRKLNCQCGGPQRLLNLEQKFNKVYSRIQQKCYNEKCHNYIYYGGRGIKMWNEWINDKKSFIQYIGYLLNAGEQGYSIDRIDNDGDYEPGNLKWSTRRQQVRNSRDCKLKVEDVIIIKKLLSEMSDAEIASRFDVTQTNIYFIRIGETWSDVS